jgi:hypothetical protein
VRDTTERQRIRQALDQTDGKVAAARGWLRVYQPKAESAGEAH